MKKIHILLFVLSIGIGTQSFSINSNEDSKLYTEFKNPGNEARPRVWWHWMNGNITKEGIRKDLLWMKRVGIGGFQNFDAGLTTPQIVNKRLTYMSPEWKDAFYCATKLADSLGLEMAIAGSPGWSQSGGPWVTAKDGMKKLVWREMLIDGNKKFNDILPNPYNVAGVFQNIPLNEDASTFSPVIITPPAFYQDIAVLAVKLPDSYKSFKELNPKLTSSGGNFNLNMLTDGDLSHTSFLSSEKGKDYSWIQFEFRKPTTINSLSIVGGGVREQWGLTPPALTRFLEVSNDGINFSKVCDIPLGGVPQQTMNIPVSTAKYFRINFLNPQVNPNAVILEEKDKNKLLPAGTDIAEIILNPSVTINHLEEKAGFASVFDLEKYPTSNTKEIVSIGDVIDITDKVQFDGRLTWTPPRGRWKIIRFGYSLTGKVNHPASPEATGLEVDKLDKDAVKRYFENYLNQYQNATRGLMGKKGLQYIITDSYEAGQMTWTSRMMQEFEKRRGYSLVQWMPVFTGLIIKSSEDSEEFLYDWRKTIGELFAENHYDQLNEILDKYGMKRYTESHENGRLFIGDGMDVKRKAAIPMSAMWAPTGFGSSIPIAKADLRESASVAHIYGQNLVAAESLTAFGLKNNAWSYTPQNLKPIADLELANGLNRFVIHTSVHQPVDDKIPGLGLFVFGQWYNRHETWADQAKAWNDYLSRSSYLLQQGKFVADIVYYYGEDNNITGLFGNGLPEIPHGFEFDFINPHALINLLSVENGKLITPSGMKYRVLAIDKGVNRMSLVVLRKIAELARKGIVICGNKPKFKGSLQDNQDEFNRLVDEVWNKNNRNVFSDMTLEQVLKSINVEPDFTYNKPQKETEVLFIHRTLDDKEIYWVNNRNDFSQKIEASFRISGKKPLIWHPESGLIEEVSYNMENEKTNVFLNFLPNEAFFVIFDETTNEISYSIPQTVEKNIINIDGSWTVKFQPDRGAPETVTFNNLMSYTENTLDGIKYFSGTAIYSKDINVTNKADLVADKLILDLGQVKNLAEVILNGKNLGVCWNYPFKVNITSELKVGINKLEVKIINTWVNRLIGDQQPNAKEKITYTTIPFYSAESTLQPAGLLGPVKIIAVEKKK